MSDLNPIHHDDNPGPSSSMGPPLFIPSSTGGPIRRRRFSTAKIQPTRIKKVMQSDEEIGRMVASVPVAIGRAMEHFAEKFLQAAAQATQLSNSRTLTPVHMKQAMMANRHFHFLADIFKEVAVPGRMGTEFDPNIARQQMQLLQAGLPSMVQANTASPVCSPCTPISPMDASGSTPYGVPQSPNGSPFSVPLPASVPYNMPYSPLLPNMTVGGQAQNVNPMQYQSTAVTMAAAIPSPPVVPATSTRKAPNGKKSEPYPEGEKPKRGRPRKIKRSEKCLDEELCEEVTNGIEKEDQDRALMPPPALPLGRAKPVA
ncbi:hypothetical protein Y032_0479g2227 [Ancylostoma ceylanicum]|uniref:Transcription factor CBF/NF-Y/archaeal histone domain-containing protein n=1 Tax=Ancylostoma ceylanicum TaxID=53326 RepID=A0A016WVL0_9BILA|nr:hypothetical protein Y032_0479g2227 [Ancylostoma ceylanicum]